MFTVKRTCFKRALYLAADIKPFGTRNTSLADSSVAFRTRYLLHCGRRGGSVVSASDMGPEGREFEPWPVHLRCVLRQNT